MIQAGPDELKDANLLTPKDDQENRNTLAPYFSHNIASQPGLLDKETSFVQHESCSLRMITLLNLYWKTPPFKLVNADISSATFYAGYLVSQVTTLT